MAVVGLCQISLNYSLKQKLFTNRGIVITNKCALLCPMSFCPNIVRYCVPCPFVRILCVTVSHKYFPRKKIADVHLSLLCIFPFCAYVPFVHTSLLCICPFVHKYVPFVHMSPVPMSDKNVPIVKKVAGGHHSLRVISK